MSDPLCHPPIAVPLPFFVGRSRPRWMSLSSGGTAPSPWSIVECATSVGGSAYVIRSDCDRLCQVLPEDCVHIDERAFAPNQTPETVTAVTSFLSSNLRVSFVS